MKLQAICEARYAAQRLTVMIKVSYLFLIENMLYDRAALFNEPQFREFDEEDLDYGEKFMDDIIGHEHDSFDLIRIQDGYAHARPTSHGEPDFVIDEESFDHAVKEGWLEITG